MVWHLTVLKHYAAFSGRARRKEYWKFVLIKEFSELCRQRNTSSGRYILQRPQQLAQRKSSMKSNGNRPSTSTESPYVGATSKPREKTGNKTDSRYEHRNVSITSETDSMLSEAELSDTNGSRASLYDRQVSAEAGRTSDYFTASEMPGNEGSLSDLESDSTPEPDTDHTDESESDSQWSDSSSEESTTDIPFNDSDTGNDGIISADSDSEVLQEAVSPKRRKRERVRAQTTRPQSREPIVLPEPIGQVPLKKRASHLDIVTGDSNLSVKRFVSKTGEQWVERTRTVSEKDPELRNILKDDAFEANILSSLNHPNIISLKGFKAEQVKDQYKLTMATEYGGIRFDDMLHDSSIQSLPKLMGYAEQLMDGLDYLQQQELMHRDIKPANVLVNQKSGALKIIDFGIAHDCRTGFPSTSGGTDYFLAPEVGNGFPHDYSADVYSAGMLLISSMMDLNILSQGTIRHLSSNRQIKLQLKGDLKLNEGQEDLVDLVQTMIDIDPEVRPSAAYVRNAIRRYLAKYQN